MASQGEFIIGEIKRFVGLPSLLVLGVIGSPRKEVVICRSEVIKGSLHHAFGDLVGPGIVVCPKLVELFFECERIGRREHALLFGNGFLFLLVRLILLLPLFSSAG